ncbi:MAG: hypothetical protein HC822_16675 [Oscillochloris sp.]|nr:hypothetical protein [Oscillochloris sp.]
MKLIIVIEQRFGQSKDISTSLRELAGHYSDSGQPQKIYPEVGATLHFLIRQRLRPFLNMLSRHVALVVATLLALLIGIAIGAAAMLVLEQSDDLATQPDQCLLTPIILAPPHPSPTRPAFDDIAAPPGALIHQALLPIHPLADLAPQSTRDLAAPTIVITSTTLSGSTSAAPGHRLYLPLVAGGEAAHATTNALIPSATATITPREPNTNTPVATTTATEQLIATPSATNLPIPTPTAGATNLPIPNADGHLDHPGHPDADRIGNPWCHGNGERHSECDRHRYA